MKKLFSIALVAGMFSFYACDQPAEETTETEVQVEETQPTAEEPVMETEVEVEADTTMTPTETPAQ